MKWQLFVEVYSDMFGESLTVALMKYGITTILKQFEEYIENVES